MAERKILFYLLLQKVTKTANEAGKSITLNRPWMLSENVMHVFIFYFLLIMQKPEFKHREFESKSLFSSPDVTLSKFSPFVRATSRRSLLNRCFYF